MIRDIVFSDNFVGSIDFVTRNRVIGWVLPKGIRNSDPDIFITIYVNGRCCGGFSNSIIRKDLLNKGMTTDGRGGINHQFVDENIFESTNTIELFDKKDESWICRFQFELSASSYADSERIFFLHIPKTGGTSLVLSLRDNFTSKEVYPGLELIRSNNGNYPDWRSAINDPAVSDARLIVGHYPFVFSRFSPGIKVVTILRNPVSRLISHLKHLKTYDRRFGEATFEDILGSGFILDNTQTRYLCDDQLDKDNMVMFSSAKINSDHLEMALENLRKCDVLGVTENMKDFFSSLKSRYNLELNDKIHANKTQILNDIDIPNDVLEKYVKYDTVLYEYALKFRSIA